MPLVAPLQQRITELRAEKERLQAALLASDFDYLDNFFKSRESNAADLDEINHPELFDAHTGPDAHGQLRLLQSWTEARPNTRAVGWRIFHRAGLAFCCRSRLSSNVRRHRAAPQRWRCSNNCSLRSAD